MLAGRYVPATEARQVEAALYEGVFVPTAFRRRLDRVLRTEVAEAESQLATDGEKLKQAKQNIDVAFDLAKNCAASYGKAKPDVRKMWNRAFFDNIRVRNCTIDAFTYEEPFVSLLGSHKGSMVDLRGHYSNSVEDLQALLRDCERLGY